VKTRIGLAEKLVRLRLYAGFLQLLQAGIGCLEKGALLVHLLLELPRVGQSLLPFPFGWRRGRPGEDLGGNGIHAHEQIKAITQGAGKPATVSAKLGFCTSARSMWVAQIATGTRVAGRDQ